MKAMTSPIIQLLIKGDDYLLKRHYDALLHKYVDPGSRDFNFESLQAGQLSGHEIVEHLNTQPFMGGMRTLVLEQAEKLNKDDLLALDAYLKNPSPYTNFILIADKIDKRKTFYKTFVKVGEVHEFKTPYANQVPEWLSLEAKKMGIKLQAGAGEYLAEMVGTNLMALVQELDKLKTYVYPRQEVTKEEVSDLVSAGAVQNVFLISSYLGKRNFPGALGLYRKMQEQGEAPHKIIALITSHFRKLLLLKSAPAQTNAASLLGVSPYFVKEYEAQIRKFSLSQLTGIYQQLMVASLGLRSTGASGHTVMESFLQKTCLS
jgi:DNA polymerase III subunit delta